VCIKAAPSEEFPTCLQCGSFFKGLPLIFLCSIYKRGAKLKKREKGKRNATRHFQRIVSLRFARQGLPSVGRRW
jgi:hypothetical protein